MSKLYIIGNGFDLKHELPSSYKQFGEFCKTNYRKVYETTQELFPIMKSDLWCDFENNLAKIDFEKLKTTYEQAINSGNLRNDYILGEFQNDLQDAFKDWIVSLKNLTKDLSKQFTFDDSDRFISFNYTDVLEHLYGISPERILHIHGYASLGGETELFVGYIYGHGEDKIKTTDYLDSWNDQKSYFFNGLRKNYNENVIEKFLSKKSASNISEINVWGHSMDKIDDVYFREIQNIKWIPDDVKWNIYYRSEKNYLKKLEAVSRLKIKNHDMIKI